MAARRSRASTLVHIERATPKIQGSEWSTEERKTRRLVAHVRELGWKTHTVSVVREGVQRVEAVAQDELGIHEVNARHAMFLTD